MAALGRKAHYVNNQDFLKAIIAYKDLCDTARDEGREVPVLPNYIGECFIKISTHLSYAGNFINYPFRDDMISDGIENCLIAAEKFDPTKSENPFAYFTQIVYYAFLRRIAKEKKQHEMRYKILENMNIEEIITQEHDSGEFDTQFLEYIKKQMEYIDPDRKVAAVVKSSAKLHENYLEFGEDE